MSGGYPCDCGAAKKPLAERPWRVTAYRCNHSAFNGYHRTPSDYSAVVCDGPGCRGAWRTKAAYVDRLLLPKSDNR